MLCYDFMLNKMQKQAYGNILEDDDEEEEEEEEGEDEEEQE